MGCLCDSEVQVVALKQENQAQYNTSVYSNVSTSSFIAQSGATMSTAEIVQQQLAFEEFQMLKRIKDVYFTFDLKIMLKIKIYSMLLRKKARRINWI